MGRSQLLSNVVRCHSERDGLGRRCTKEIPARKRKNEHGAGLPPWKAKIGSDSFKHGLSIAADRNADNVRALALLLAPPPCSDYLAALAVEAAIRIIDHNRVRDAHRIVYEQMYAGFNHPPTLTRPAQKPYELGEAVLKAIRAFTELERVPVPLLPDSAKQLDGLARYDRRTLSARERALAALDRAIATEHLQTGVDEGLE